MVLGTDFGYQRIVKQISLLLPRCEDRLLMAERRVERLLRQDKP